ncbi:MAG: hypothetical protein LBI62_02120 [Candidatus Accumulibacter sp.]|jgi:hypothetical protein|nr:hypothetical protein [Accumulibacter sp.]
MRLKRRTQFPLEEIDLPPEKAGLSAGHLVIPVLMYPTGHTRTDGLPYVDGIHGRETDNATMMMATKAELSAFDDSRETGAEIHDLWEVNP